MLNSAQMQANQQQPQQRGPTIAMRIQQQQQQRQNNALLFQTLLYQQLRAAFAQTNFTTPNSTPFTAQQPFIARMQDQSGQEHGCSVSYQNPETKFALLTPTIGSLQAMAHAVAAHQRAYNQWNNQRLHQDETVELICSLTVDSMEEIKPVLQALSQVCQIQEFYLRDPSDPTKTSVISLDVIGAIQNEIAQAQHSAPAQSQPRRQSPPQANQQQHRMVPQRAQEQRATTTTGNNRVEQPQQVPEVIVRDRPTR